MRARAALMSDIEEIEKIYASARKFMVLSGNPTQWQGGYPPRSVILRDIEDKRLYIVHENTSPSLPLAVFYFYIGEDESYKELHGGEWLLPGEEYGAIHRIALSESARGRGIASFCFNLCFNLMPNIRIDTHRDNLPMRRALIKNGFSERGIIYLENGEERIAYQKTGEWLLTQSE